MFEETHTKTVTTIKIEGGTLEFSPNLTPLITDDVSIAGTFVFEPPVAPQNETTTGDGIYRPWSWESTMLVVAALCWLAGLGYMLWGILKWVL